MFNLRYYQSAAKTRVFEEWQNHVATAIIMPTATGKTEVYLSIAVERPGRTLVVVHRDYLISSPIARLKRAGFDDVAIEKAELRSEGGYYKSQIVFASVQSLSMERRLETFNPTDFSTLIVDEGHRAVSQSYRRVLDYFRSRNPKLKVLILTATPKRKDGIGLSNVCDTVAYSMSPAQASFEGWIAKPRFFVRDVPSLDFSHVKMKGSDLDEDQVSQLLQEEKPLHEICSSLAEFQGPTIMFAPKVIVAQAYSAVMNRYRPGRSMAIHQDSTDDEMERATKGLADGTMDFVWNVDKLTEGFDVPKVMRIGWTAPTGSLVRWTQGCGRGFRVDGSIASLLVGGLEESGERRQLISQSAKPYCEILTYSPLNCKHKICTAVDLLGGDELAPDVKRYAEFIQEATSRQDAGSATDEDMETAEKFVNLKNAVEMRRRELKAKAVVRDEEFDGMGDGQVTREKRESNGANSSENRFAAAASYGNGEPLTDKQANWFKWKKIHVPEGVTKFQACIARDLIELGVKPASAFSYPKKQAISVRDSIRAKKGGNS